MPLDPNRPSVLSSPFAVVQASAGSSRVPHFCTSQKTVENTVGNTCETGGIINPWRNQVTKVRSTQKVGKLKGFGHKLDGWVVGGSTI